MRCSSRVDIKRTLVILIFVTNCATSLASIESENFDHKVENVIEDSKGIADHFRELKVNSLWPTFQYTRQQKDGSILHQFGYFDGEKNFNIFHHVIDAKGKIFSSNHVEVVDEDDSILKLLSQKNSKKIVAEQLSSFIGKHNVSLSRKERSADPHNPGSLGPEPYFFDDDSEYDSLERVSESKRGNRYRDKDEFLASRSEKYREDERDDFRSSSSRDKTERRRRKNYEDSSDRGERRRNRYDDEDDFRSDRSSSRQKNGRNRDKISELRESTPIPKAVAFIVTPESFASLLRRGSSEDNSSFKNLRNKLNFFANEDDSRESSEYRNRYEEIKSRRKPSSSSKFIDEYESSFTDESFFGKDNDSNKKLSDDLEAEILSSLLNSQEVNEDKFDRDQQKPGKYYEDASRIRQNDRRAEKSEPFIQNEQNFNPKSLDHKGLLDKISKNSFANLFNDDTDDTKLNKNKSKSSKNTSGKRPSNVDIYNNFSLSNRNNSPRRNNDKEINSRESTFRRNEKGGPTTFPQTSKFENEDKGIAELLNLLNVPLGENVKDFNLRDSKFTEHSLEEERFKNDDDIFKFLNLQSTDKPKNKKSIKGPDLIDFDKLFSESRGTNAHSKKNDGGKDIFHFINADEVNEKEKNDVKENKFKSPKLKDIVSKLNDNPNLLSTFDFKLVNSTKFPLTLDQEDLLKADIKNLQGKNKSDWSVFETLLHLNIPGSQANKGISKVREVVDKLKSNSEEHEKNKEDEKGKKSSRNGKGNPSLADLLSSYHSNDNKGLPKKFKIPSKSSSRNNKATKSFLSSTVNPRSFKKLIEDTNKKSINNERPTLSPSLSNIKKEKTFGTTDVTSFFDSDSPKVNNRGSPTGNKIPHVSISSLTPGGSPVFINSTVFVSTTPFPHYFSPGDYVPRIRTPSSLPPHHHLKNKSPALHYHIIPPGDKPAIRGILESDPLSNYVPGQNPVSNKGLFGINNPLTHTTASPAFSLQSKTKTVSPSILTTTPVPAILTTTTPGNRPVNPRQASPYPTRRPVIKSNGTPKSAIHSTLKSVGRILSNGTPFPVTQHPNIVTRTDFPTSVVPSTQFKTTPHPLTPKPVTPFGTTTFPSTQRQTTPNIQNITPFVTTNSPAAFTTRRSSPRPITPFLTTNLPTSLLHGNTPTTPFAVTVNPTTQTGFTPRPTSPILHTTASLQKLSTPQTKVLNQSQLITPKPIKTIKSNANNNKRRKHQSARKRRPGIRRRTKQNITKTVARSRVPELSKIIKSNTPSRRPSVLKTVPPKFSPKKDKKLGNNKVDRSRFPEPEFVTQPLNQAQVSRRKLRRKKSQKTLKAGNKKRRRKKISDASNKNSKGHINNQLTTPAFHATTPRPFDGHFTTIGAFPSHVTTPRSFSVDRAGTPKPSSIVTPALPKKRLQKKGIPKIKKIESMPRIQTPTKATGQLISNSAPRNPNNNFDAQNNLRNHDFQSFPLHPLAGGQPIDADQNSVGGFSILNRPFRPHTFPGTHNIPSNLPFDHHSGNPSHIHLQRNPILGHFGRNPTPGQLSGTPTPGHFRRTPTPGQLRGTPTPGHLRGTPTPGQLRGTPTPGNLRGTPTPTPGHFRRTPTPGQLRGTPTPGQLRDTSTPGHLRGTPTPIPGHFRRTPTPGQLRGTPTLGQLRGTPTPLHLRGTPTPTPGHFRRTPTPGQLRRNPTSGHLRGTATPGQLRGTPTPEQLRGTPTPGQLRRTLTPTPGQLRRNPTSGHLRGTATPGQLRGTPTPEQLRGTPTPGQLRRTLTPSHLQGTPAPSRLGSTPTAGHLRRTLIPEHLRGTPIPHHLRGTPIPGFQRNPAHHPSHFFINPNTRTGLNANGAFILPGSNIHPHLRSTNRLHNFRNPGSFAGLRHASPSIGSPTSIPLSKKQLSENEDSEELIHDPAGIEYPDPEFNGHLSPFLNSDPHSLHSPHLLHAGHSLYPHPIDPYYPGSHIFPRHPAPSGLRNYYAPEIHR